MIFSKVNFYQQSIEAWSIQMKRMLLALLLKLGELGVPISSEIEYDNLKMLTERLYNKVIKQGRSYEPDLKQW